MFAVQANGAEILTMRASLPPKASFTQYRKPSGTKHALQCGFCTPGMIMVSKQIIERNPSPSDTQIARVSMATFAAARVTSTSSKRSARRESRSLSHGHNCYQDRQTGRKRIRRKEDPRLITGTATYVEDIKRPEMQHASSCAARMARPISKASTSRRR